jgi:mannose-6-phosphate isomerase-like protein (cupin superfamily)
MVEEFFRGDHGKHMVLLKRMQDKKGAAERHECASEVYYVVEGSATLRVGGSIVDEKQMPHEGEGEYKAAELVDCEEMTMQAGDLISIKKNEPHQADATGSEVLYLIIKFYD